MSVNPMGVKMEEIDVGAIGEFLKSQGFEHMYREGTETVYAIGKDDTFMEVKISSDQIYIGTAKQGFYLPSDAIFKKVA